MRVNRVCWHIPDVIVQANQELNLVGLVELLEADPVLSVDGLLLHLRRLVEIANREVAAKKKKMMVVVLVVMMKEVMKMMM